MQRVNFAAQHSQHAHKVIAFTDWEHYKTCWFKHALSSSAIRIWLLSKLLRSFPNTSSWRTVHLLPSISLPFHHPKAFKGPPCRLIALTKASSLSNRILVYSVTQKCYISQVLCLKKNCNILKENKSLLNMGGKNTTK